MRILSLEMSTAAFLGAATESSPLWGGCLSRGMRWEGVPVLLEAQVRSESVPSFTVPGHEHPSYVCDRHALL